MFQVSYPGLNGLEVRQAPFQASFLGLIYHLIGYALQESFRGFDTILA